YPRTVYAALRLAIESLPGESTAILFCLSFFGPDRIPDYLARDAVSALSEDRFNQCLSHLLTHSILRRTSFDDGTSAITVHRLILEVVKALGEPNDRDLPVRDGAVLTLLRNFSAGSDSPSARRRCEQLTPLVLAMSVDEKMRHADKKWIALATTASRYLS